MDIKRQMTRAIKKHHKSKTNFATVVGSSREMVHHKMDTVERKFNYINEYLSKMDLELIIIQKEQ